jgi:hypothetical protein
MRSKRRLCLPTEERERLKRQGVSRPGNTVAWQVAGSSPTVIRSDSGLKQSSMTPADRQGPSVIQENLVFAGAVKLEGTHPR